MNIPYGIWRVYDLGFPLDFWWEFSPGYEQVMLSGVGEDDYDQVVARTWVFDFGRLLGLIPYQDKVRTPPHCILLPDPPGCYLAGVVWKIDNNGTTYLASPNNTAARLAGLCGDAKLVSSFVFPRFVCNCSLLGPVEDTPTLAPSRP